MNRQPLPERLTRLLRELNCNRDRVSLSRAVLRFAMSVVSQAEAGAFLILNQRGDAFECMAAVGWDIERLSESEVPKDKVVGNLFAAARPVIITDPGRVTFRPEQLRPASSIALPIVCEGTIIACLALDSRSDPAAFSREDIELLQPLLEEIGTAVRLERARARLAERDEIFHLVWDHLADSLFITDLNGTILECNAAAEQQTGYCREELLQLNIMRDLAIEEPSVTYEKINQVLARGETGVFEERKQRKDGTSYWTECAVVHFEYQGQPATISVNREISNRKAMTEQLEQRIAQLNALNRAGREIISTLEPEEVLGKIVSLAGDISDSSYTSIVLVDEEGVPRQSVDEIRGIPTSSVRIRSHGMTARIIATGEPVIVDEVFEDGSTEPPVPSWGASSTPIPANPHIVQAGMKSLVGVPITSQGKVAGVLYVHSDIPHAFGNQLAVLSSFANHAAVAIDNARLYRAAQQELAQRRQLEEDLHRLNRGAVALSSTLELGELLELIHGQIADLIAPDAFSIALVDSRKRELRLEFSIEEGRPLPKRVHPLKEPQTLTGWVASSMEMLLVHDVERERESLPAPVDPAAKPVRSWLGIPLVFQQQAIGVMTMQSFQPHAFGERESQLATALAGAAAAAITRADLHADLTRMAGRLRTVEEASRQMKLAESRDELYGMVLDSVHQVLGYQACAILEERGDALEIVVERGYFPEAQGSRIPLYEDKGITAASFTAREPVYVPDVSIDPRYLPGIPGAQCELALPLAVGERQFGVLNVEHRQADGIPAEDRDLLMIIASELAVGLLSLQRLAGVLLLSEKLAGLHLTVQRLQRCASEIEVLEVAVQVARELLGFDICAIDILEEDVLIPRAASGAAVELARPSRKGEDLTAKTWETGQTFWGNVQDFPEARPARGDFRSFVSTPIGDLGVFQAIGNEPNRFTEDDVRLVEILAGHLREEIQRVRLEAKLRQQAIRDPLTGLHNRRHLSEVLERDVQRSRRYGNPFELVLIDIDNFKLLNDRYGHLRGDEILQGLAQLMRQEVRESDLIFRYGGDEFVLLLPESCGEARKVAVRLKRAVTRWAENEGLQETGFDLSFGVARCTSEGSLSVEELLKEADASLYQEKRRKKQRRRH